MLEWPVIKSLLGSFVFKFYLLCLPLGAISGLLSGLIGIGGGLVIVPALFWLLMQQGLDQSLAMRSAIATSVACIVFTTANSAYHHGKMNNINWQLVRSLLPGLFVGSIFGAILSHLTSGSVLQLIFGGFSAAVAVKMLRAGHDGETKPLPGAKFLALMGSLISTLSALLGLGGGVMLVPFFSHYRLAMQKAVGTSNFCSFSVATICLSTHLLLDFFSLLQTDTRANPIHWLAAAAILATSLVFGPIGVKLSSRLSSELLRRIFGCLLLIVAARMILTY